jgi:hypothetical protein
VSVVALALTSTGVTVLALAGSPVGGRAHRHVTSSVPAALPVPGRLGVPPKAPPGKVVLRQGTTVLYPGEELDLDAAHGWPYTRGASGDPWDVEFTLAYRDLEGETGKYTALAYIAKPANSYDDCLTSDYSGVVPASAVRVGSEFCMITSERHRSLVTIIGIQRDGMGASAINLYITTWSCVVINDVCR